MTKTVTPTMLRNKLQRVSSPNYKGSGGLGTTSTNNTTTEEEEDTTKQNNTKITIQQFQEIQHNEIILKDKTRATILFTYPCLKWKCLVTPDDKGVMKLTKPLEATILKLGKEQYCIGIRGSTKELETIIDMGTSEMRINDDYINIKTKHLVVNGKEVHK